MAKASEASRPTSNDDDLEHRQDKIITVEQAISPLPAPAMASMDAKGSDPNVLLNCVTFFVFGLSNNVIYVVFFSAAADFLAEDKSIPKSLVILVNIVPSMCVKFFCPYVLPLFSYRFKVLVTACVSLAALQIVAWSTSIPMRFVGIGLASAGSGFGECVFLSLASFYSDHEISSWSSGTGGAGLVGAVLYFVLSTVLELPFYLSMCLISCFPLSMMIFYQWTLAEPPQRKRVYKTSGSSKQKNSVMCVDSATSAIVYPRQQQKSVSLSSPYPSLDASPLSLSPPPPPSPYASSSTSFTRQLRLISPLLVPYILPLFIVYFMEYLNMSIMYTILFPLSDTPFKYYEEEFRTYSVMYQIGVFISRSSLTFAPIEHIWILTTLQTATLIIFLLDSVLRFIPSIYVVFILLLWVGLLGGSAYVNTYASIQRKVHPDNLEFSMAVTGVADSIGISLAALMSLVLEPALCSRNSLCRAHTRS